MPIGSAAALAAYLAFALLAVVGPGIALQRLLRLPVDPALVLPGGLAFSAAAYAAALVSGQGWLYPGLVLAVDLTLLRGVWRRAEGPSLAGALPALGCVVAFLALAQYGENRPLPDDSFSYDAVLPDDAAFHVGLTHELTFAYPPQIPGLSGFEMSYHVGASLVRAAALRYAGVDPYDALSRGDNTLFAIALVLALRALVHALGGGAFAVGLAGFAPLLSDLSFLLAPGRGIDWWVALFEGGTGLLSLAQANSLVPALALAAGSLVALERFGRDARRGQLTLAALLALACAYFKVFVGAQLLGGLLLALALAGGRRASAAVGLPLALATGALVLGGGGETMRVLLDPLSIVQYARHDLGLEAVTGVWLLAWTPAWLVISLGARLAGLPAAARALLSGRAVAVAAAGFALSGWPAGLLFRVSPIETGLRERPFNEALYFFEQSGIVLWLFVALAIGRLATRHARLAAAALCAALALPSSVQFVLHKRAAEPRAIRGEAVRAMRALVAASRPSDVALMRPDLQRYPPPPLALAGRRVPFTRYIPFYSQFLPIEARVVRYQTALRIFQTDDTREARRILRELDVSFVCLFGADQLRFETAGLLERIYQEGGARVYRVLGEGATPSPPAPLPRR